MIEKGTMRNVKRILGVILAVFSINYFYPISLINSIPEIFHIIIMAASAFFLIKSGMRD